MLIGKNIFNNDLSINNRLMSSRPEQKKLRNYLIKNKQPICIICQKEYPLYVLECAHIKPRSLSTWEERYDYNIVNWMCRNCHKIYDKGTIGIKDGFLIKNSDLSNFEFNFKTTEYNRSSKYFDYHFENIKKLK